ncbi:MAG: Gfo/Idh/MocA family oxidoreductase [Gemmatimonadales bacterium]|jgi:predicted dehydrogenase
MTDVIDRRSFIARSTAAGLGVGVWSAFPALRTSFAPSDRIQVGVMGVNSRGSELAQGFARAGTEVAYICDVDSRAADATIAALSAWQERRPSGVADFRRALDDPDLDALVVAAPDHWHAPASILALQASKHIYVEKPCGHNPREGELLVQAQRRYGQLVQMGNQQRSAPESIAAMDAIRAGIIGRPYYARAWYANTRGTIGRGKVAEVPSWLDYDLWQGPAPRTPYRDNVVHYNWHWFWRWGTGEICNNGTHELDVCRWALGVDYPARVSSAGGRYHFDDDWECPDTQVASFDFADGMTITWDGRSCNGRPVEGRGRGASIHGTEGTIVIDRAGYVVYDKDNNEIERRLRGDADDALDTRGGGSLTDMHIANFLAAIRGEEALTAPIDDGHKSVLLCHLGNIAQRTGRTLHCDPATGRIVGDAEALALWTRDYEPGWQPEV